MPRMPRLTWHIDIRSWYARGHGQVQQEFHAPLVQQRSQQLHFPSAAEGTHHSSQIPSNTLKSND